MLEAVLYIALNLFILNLVKVLADSIMKFLELNLL